MPPILRSVLVIFLLAMSAASVQAQAKIPTADEVKVLLVKEPITEASWPVWKQRLTDWFGDLSRSTDAAYKEAERFAGGLADGRDELPARFDRDHLTWYFLGGYYLNWQPVQKEDLKRAES